MAPNKRPSLARWIAIFAMADAALIAFMLLVLWASNGFEGLGLESGGLIALILGSTGTAALGIALMGLVFFSNRSGQDEDVYRTGPPAPDGAKDPGSSRPEKARDPEIRNV